MRIWVDENIPLGRETFGGYGTVIPFAGRSLARTDLGEAAAPESAGQGGAAPGDALIVRSVTRVGAELLAGTRIRFVGTATIGTDHVDQAYLAGRGIGFASAPGCNAVSVAEYVTAALLHLRPRGFACEGKTLGIVGWGNVGRQVEKKALALGMNVLRCDPPLMERGAPPDFFVALETLLARSDVVTVHVPLTRQGPHATLNLADVAFFARLTRPAVFFNTCRGGVADEAALKVALGAGRVRHLILDVFAGEPRIDAGLCASADLISPHIAGYSLQGKLNGTFQIAEAFRRHFALPAAALPDVPRPAHPAIAYPAEAVADWDFIRHCVRHAYDIAADDRRLRQALKADDPGKEFDRLRKEYPVRHEFTSYSITGLPPEKRELRSRLQALGFRAA